VLAGQVNRVAALGVGLIGAGIAGLLLVATRSVWAFGLAAALYWVFTRYVYVVLLSTAATIDPKGRLGTLCLAPPNRTLRAGGTAPRLPALGTL
jgi:hypothetical protein